MATDYYSYLEFKEGYNDYYNGKSNKNPYPWTNTEWWRNEAYEEGYKYAESCDYDDDN